MSTVFSTLLDKHPELEVCLPDLTRSFELLRASFQQGGKLLVCGNGGSAADSEHIVGELMKGYLQTRPIPHAMRQKLQAAYPDQAAYLASNLQGALPAISLVSQSALVSAFANDVAADMVFAQQVYGYGLPGDVLLALSTSGRSVNVLHALRVGRTLGLRTIAFSGPTGGSLRPLCDVLLCVPGRQVNEIQEGHMALYHALCAVLEEAFFC